MLRNYTIGKLCSGRLGESDTLPILTDVQPRPAEVDAAFYVFVAADAEAGDGDVRGGDAELEPE